MTDTTGLIEVFCRKVDGTESVSPADDTAAAMKIAKQRRRPDAHMVCVVVGGVRTLRWDRTNIVGTNSWRKVAPCKMEILGAVSAIKVTYVTAEEVQAEYDQWLADSRTDNQAYADQLNKKIADEVINVVPRVREAVVTYYNAYCMPTLLADLKREAMNPEVYNRYVALRDKYCSKRFYDWPYILETEYIGLGHPSKSIPNSLADQLKERGFRRTMDGWRDARGVSIPEIAWIESISRPDYGPHQLERRWYDPAGIQEIIAGFDVQFQCIVKICSPVTLLCRAASHAGHEAYLNGHALLTCPFATGTLQSAEWITAWEKAQRYRRDLPHIVTSQYRSAGVEWISYDVEPFRERKEPEKPDFFWENDYQESLFNSCDY